MRLVVHDRAEAGPFAVALALDPRTSLLHDADGSVTVTRVITDYTDAGVPAPNTVGEYVIKPPIVIDGSPDPAAPVLAAPATMTLRAAPTPELVISIDPGWLNDPRRVFPLRVDLPIITAYAEASSGVFGAVNSCAPAVPAPLSDMIVGAEAGCVFHGQASFNLTALLYDTPIVSASLWLYAPGQTGPTSVQVYPNAPAPKEAPWQLPSWAGAPPVVAGATGIAESGGGSGGWHSWDVTALLRQWVADAGTNNGLTLAGTGAPIAFASPLGAGSGDATSAPYLAIVFGPRPTVSPAYNDGAPFIYGFSGSIASNVSAGGCNATLGSCTASNGQIVPARPGSETTMAIQKIVANTVSGGQPSGPGAGYFRLGVTLNCWSNTPGQAWWNSDDQAPYAAPSSGGGHTTHYGSGYPIDADPYNIGSALAILSQIATIDTPNTPPSLYNLIPIINVTPNPACATNAAQWYNQVKDFIMWMNSKAYGAYRPIYFEIGNEENGTDNSYAPYGGATAYESIFASAAQGIKDGMAATGNSWGNNYRVLTGGMMRPTAVVDPNVCPASYANVGVAAAALSMAQSGTYNVPLSHLGFAVHPYKYTTSNTSYWRNYVYWGGATIGTGGFNACYDLASLTGTWTSQYASVPLIFTEDNWNDQPPGQNEALIGSYMVDLFTWLYDKPAVGTGSFADAASSPIRVAWYRTNDADTPLGIYYGGGTPKNVTIPYCDNPAITPGSTSTLQHDWFYLRFGACY